jgi:serine/threonine protein kinase
VPTDDPPKRGVPQPIRGGPIKFGPYLLDARIAVGGTAEVYLARPRPETKGNVERLIVKRLLPHFLSDPDGRTMFEREALLHAAVTHPNVVKVFESGLSESGEPYLAMEYVDGVDAYRLLRRIHKDGRLCPPHVSVHIIREVLKALGSVHGARDPAGDPMGIIHRDVTPSNLYLSKDGDVKLGDFGIARSTRRATMRNAASAMLKGKIAYLAPEQVAGEPFDARADLFSVAAVLAEMLIGKPLFPGAGQLAILLAIRDCRIEPLREVKDKLPAGLFDVLERALAREANGRFQTAAAFGDALAPFDPHPDATHRELAFLVTRAQATQSSDGMKAVRESASAMRAARVERRPEESSDAGSLAGLVASDEEPTTARYAGLPSFVVTSDGTRHGPWTFAQLVEALATGEVGRGDQVGYMGRDLKAVEEIDDLVRFLQPQSVTTHQLSGPAAPDFLDDLATTPMLDVLLRVLENHETGVLFAERTAAGADEAGRKELYFLDGKLHHVASSNASELLGEYLVRHGRIERGELDLALAVLPRYNGRIGDTLIALGLANPLDIVRAIREQGRDRVADIFTWKQGKVSFYRGQAAPHVEFPLALDLPALILAGLEASEPGDAPIEAFRDWLDNTLVRGPADRRGLVRGIKWPPAVTGVMAACSGPLTLRELLQRTSGGGAASPGTTAGDVLRVLRVLLAGKLLAWKGP